MVNWILPRNTGAGFEVEYQSEASARRKVINDRINSWKEIPPHTVEGAMLSLAAWGYVVKVEAELDWMNGKVKFLASTRQGSKDWGCMSDESQLDALSQLHKHLIGGNDE
jgi:hypothetical protein